MKEIKINCKGADALPYNKILQYQGNLKELTKENYDKLKRSIESHGFAEPVTAWNKDGEIKCANGHQRLRTIKNMVENEGFSCPPIPVNWVYPKDEDDFARIVLSLASQFGQFTGDGVYEYMMEHRIAVDEIASDYRFPEINIQDFMDNYFEGSGSSSSSSSTEGDLYTKKIEAPIYEPTGEKPELTQLFDYDKSNALIKEIQESKLPEEVKIFLTLAAQRHVVFNYAKIAEYYAHAPKEVQDLMEKSALVIIDFQKAIENGFVSLTKEIAETYPETAPE